MISPVRRRVLRGAALLGLVVIGCKDGTTAVRLTDILGVWELVQLNRTSATTGEVTDAMQSGEITSFTLTIAADGTVATVTTSDVAAPVTGSGTIVVSGNRTKLVLDGTAFYGSVVVKGGQIPSTAV